MRKSRPSIESEGIVNTNEIVVVDPAAEDAVQQAALAARLSTLEGTRIALIGNAKHMAEEMLREVESLLKARYGVAEVSYYRKRNASVPTPPEVLADLAARCDAVVHGVAD
jgi:hypothetical protein